MFLRHLEAELDSKSAGEKELFSINLRKKEVFTILNMKIQSLSHSSKPVLKVQHVYKCCMYYLRYIIERENDMTLIIDICLGV